ncbi:MAG: hypothetical protein JO337_07210 [Acidimicrobiales bacterium]|nr:hypothetical protein [Acidimicrobiales bacterium]
MPVSTPTPDRMVIVDPRGRIEQAAVEAPKRLSTLEGKTVGIILDGPWRSWFVMADRIAAILDEQGVKTKQLALGAQSLDMSDFPVERLSNREDASALDAFAAQVDAVLVGLGN